MHRPNGIGTLAALVIVVISMPVSYGGVVLANRYDVATTPGLQVLGRPISYGAWQATPITTGNASYSILSIAAEIHDVNPALLPLLQIWTANFNSEPGSKLAELVLTLDTPTLKTYEPANATTLTLSPHTSYFVVAGAPNGSGDWEEQANFANPLGPYFQADGIWRLGTLDGANPLLLKTFTSSDAGSTWQSDSLLSGPLRLSIDAVPAGGPPVPEIDPSAIGTVLALLSSGLALLERRRA